MNSSAIDKKEYEEVLMVLEKRSRTIRRNVFLLIYFVVTLGAVVAVVAYNINNKSTSPLASAISSAIESNDEGRISKLFQKALLGEKGQKELFGEIRNPEYVDNSEKVKKDVDSMTDKEVEDEIQSNLRGLEFRTPEKSTSEKIAESISALVISFSVLMFIGFVMRVLFVFIKYYMQLGADYENQRIAFMLSKGENEDFTKTLSVLREQNIGFEKSPTLPQEKMIDKVIELTRALKTDSNKN